jgi:hypothetical protein
MNIKMKNNMFCIPTGRTGNSFEAGIVTRQKGKKKPALSTGSVTPIRGIGLPKGFPSCGLIAIQILLRQEKQKAADRKLGGPLSSKNQKKEVK